MPWQYKIFNKISLLILDNRRSQFKIIFISDTLDTYTIQQSDSSVFFLLIFALYGLVLILHKLTHFHPPNTTYH